MTKLPKRRKANGKYNGLDPDQPLTELQAVEYARQRGFRRLTKNKLTQSRTEPPRCPGPKFRRIDGRIEYTPRFLEEYFEARKPQVIDPAERRREAS